MPQKSRYTIEILDLSLDVIDILLSTKDKYQSSSDIAKALQINRSRAYRILKTLEQRSYVSSSSTEDGFRLGPKFIQIGEQIRSFQDIRLIARPFLEKLANETGETVNLSMRYADEIMMVDNQRGHHRILIDDPIGTLYPLHAGAGAKVFLAYMPKSEQEHLIESITLQRFTPNTITDRDKLRRVLDKILAQGYGIDEEEQELGVWGVGAPIHDATQQVAACVSLYVSINQYDDKGREELIRPLVDTCKQISLLLGWEGNP
jgi:DNA-binding IclR family transcriptional regulator